MARHHTPPNAWMVFVMCHGAVWYNEMSMHIADMAEHCPPAPTQRHFPQRSYSPIVNWLVLNIKSCVHLYYSEHTGIW